MQGTNATEPKPEAPGRTRKLGIVAAALGAVALLVGALLFGRGLFGDASAGRAVGASREPATRSLPRFEGALAKGGLGSTDMLRGRRGLVYVFATTDRDADTFAGLVKRLAADASDVNVAVLGVNRDLRFADAASFMTRQQFAFPIILDSDLSISRRLGVPPGQSALFVVDSEGQLTYAFAGLTADLPEPEKLRESEVRRVLHMETPGADLAPALGLLPPAPALCLRSTMTNSRVPRE